MYPRIGGSRNLASSRRAHPKSQVSNAGTLLNRDSEGNSTRSPAKRITEPAILTTGGDRGTGRKRQRRAIAEQRTT